MILEALKRLFARPRLATGPWGEERAAAFLRKEGYRIIGRNVRPNRHDEIDIIARKGESLVFVEVKTRGSEDFGRPSSAVDAKKRHALNRAVASYLRKLRYPELYYRLDIVEVVGGPSQGRAPEIRHLENAIPFEERFRFPVK